jgi:hypothetical protein
VTERAHEGLKNMMEHCLKTDKEIGTSFPCCRNVALHVISICLWYFSLLIY